MSEVSQVATSAKHYQIPDGVFVVLDDQNRQWTNIDGAVVLASKSRRTIHEWIRNEWITVRRAAGGRPEILVSSLWQDQA
jgi:hypothetical protein